jgi:hypothetical protein
MKRSIRALTIALFFVIGCDNTAVTPEGNPGPNNTEQTVPDHWTPTTPDDHGSTILDPAGVSEGKTARRLTVDQLRRSIPALFAGLTWTIGDGGRRAVGFNALARTLGEPDYIQSTTNNLDASPLFAKYMDDMAGDVCTKAIERDRTTANASDRLIMRETDVDANLRYLRLKLHALYVPAGSTDSIVELRQLYDDVVAESGNPDDGWFAVCVAMLSAPEFMTY